MPPAQKRKRTPEKASPSSIVSGQSCLRAFFAQSSSNTPSTSHEPNPALRRPTTAEQEEEDLRRAIEASLQDDSLGLLPSGLQKTARDHSLSLEAVDDAKVLATKVIDVSSDDEEVALALTRDSEPAFATSMKNEHQDELTKFEEREETRLSLPDLTAEADDVPATESKPDMESSKAGWSRLGLGRGLAAMGQAQKDKKADVKGGPNSKARRTAPFYKVLRGMPLSVDAFTYGKIEGCQGYFLSHFHSDHYGSLSKNWSHGPIYCSRLTAALCQRCLGVDPQYLRPLDFDVPSTVPDSGGVSVTLIPANHCPGSALFLFEGPCTHDLVDVTFTPARTNPSHIARYLHCGDFRASPSHTSHPSLRGKALDLIYLDTTYCNPKYIFPPQPLVIQACVDLVLSSVARLLPSTAQDVPGINPIGLAGPPIRPSRQLSLPFAKASSPPPPPCLGTWFKRSAPIESNAEAPQEGLAGSNPEPVPEPPHGTCDAAVSQRRDLCSESGLVVMIGTYTIGKERLVLALAEALGTKIFCANPRQRLMWADVARCAVDQERVQRDRPALGPGEEAANVLLHEETALARLTEYLTNNPSEAGVHVVRLGSVSPEQSRAYLAQLSAQRAKQNRPPIRHALSLRPTGWTFRPSTAPAPAQSDSLDDDADEADQAPNWTAVLKSAPSREKNKTLSPHELLHSWQKQGYSTQDIGRTRGSGDGLEVVPIPYSEHSSFVCPLTPRYENMGFGPSTDALWKMELTAFVLSLARWTKIIPTVGVGSPAGRARMQAHFAQWSAAQGQGSTPTPRGDNYW